MSVPCKDCLIYPLCKSIYNKEYNIMKKQVVEIHHQFINEIILIKIMPRCCLLTDYIRLFFRTKFGPIYTFSQELNYKDLPNPFEE